MTNTLIVTDRPSADPTLRAMLLALDADEGEKYDRVTFAALLDWLEEHHTTIRDYLKVAEGLRLLLGAKRMPKERDMVLADLRLDAANWTPDRKAATALPTFAYPWVWRWACNCTMQNRMVKSRRCTRHPHSPADSCMYRRYYMGRAATYALEVWAATLYGPGWMKAYHNHLLGYVDAPNRGTFYCFGNRSMAYLALACAMAQVTDLDTLDSLDITNK